MSSNSDPPDDDGQGDASAPNGILDNVVPLDAGDALSDAVADMPTTRFAAVSSEPDDVPPDPGSADAASPRLQSIVESLLFAADKPLSLRQLGDILGESELARVRGAVAAVERAQASRGIQLHSVAGGY